MLTFSFWESIARNNLKLLNDKITNLVFKTFELCSKNFEVIDFIELPPELPKPEEEYSIFDNKFAFLDYAFHVYFIFRARLCKTNSHEFVVQYDEIFKKAFAHYATAQYAISSETIHEF